MDVSAIYDPSIPKTLDEEEQRDLFEAFFQVISCQEWDWFEGVIFQRWDRYKEEDIPVFPDYIAEFYGPLGEKIEGKLAEETVREWFNSNPDGCLFIGSTQFRYPLCVI